MATKDDKGKAVARRRAKTFQSQKGVQDASQFDYGTTKKDKKAGETVAQNREANYLIKNKGMDKGDVYADIAARQADGMQVNDRLQNRMDKYNARQENIAARQDAKAKAQAAKAAQAAQGGGTMNTNVTGDGNQVGDNNTAVEGNDNIVGDNNKRDSDNFAVGGDLNQNIGKSGDQTTTVGDGNTFGAGASIGNDYSVTIGNQSAGNNNSGGSGSGGGSGLSNMQSAAAYSALNNNAWAKSSSQLNGYGRAAGASEEAAKITGATDRVATLYNMTGADQKYWNDKAVAQQGSYLGDIFNFRAPDWVMPPDPAKPEDKTEEIADEFDP